MDAHEFFGETVVLIDDALASFLDTIDPENTTVLYFSDHGLHMNMLYEALKIEENEIEMNLPSLFISIPSNANLSGKQLENLQNN